MCQEIVSRRKFACQHLLDSPGYLREWDNCGNCGEIKDTAHLGTSTSHDPCDDCKADGSWVQNRRGFWHPAAEVPEEDRV